MVEWKANGKGIVGGLQEEVEERDQRCSGMSFCVERSWKYGGIENKTKLEILI